MTRLSQPSLLYKPTHRTLWALILFFSSLASSMLVVRGSMASGVPQQSFRTPYATEKQPAHESLPAKPLMTNEAKPSTASDPLQSPYPIPWTPIWDHQQQASTTGEAVALKYTSPKLSSPDGTLKAFSQIDVFLAPNLTESHIKSQLIIQNRQNQTLQTIPSSMHLGQSLASETATHIPGTLAMLVPATWSEDSQQLLVRQFEALFGSDMASDYGLIWQRTSEATRSVAPQPVNYDSATLLGWSQNFPDQLLFRTSIIGETDGNLLAVDLAGDTIASPGDRPMQFGQHLTPEPQASR